MRALAIFVASLATITASAQTTTFSQAPHVKTALNHFTVFDPCEPITMFAIADHASFDVDRRGDKLFLEPIRDNAATNLFIWTASREIIYEIDPAGEVAKMDMLLRNAPPSPNRANRDAVDPEQKDQEIQKAASLALTEALVGTENILDDDQRSRTDAVSVRLEGVFHSKDRMYIRYSVLNLSKTPFRLTSPDIFQPLPSQTPISILSLRNHQLTDQTFAMFKTTHGSTVSVIQSELQVHDLAPGQKATGVICIRNSQTSSPQLYRLDFGTYEDHPLTVEAVL